MAEYFPPPPPGTQYAYYPPQPPQPYIAQLEPPPPYVPTLAPYNNPYGDVRTLFVAGLPEDVKPREIYNLFREFPGYESSHLRTPSHACQPFAFAVFSDQQSAVVAMQALNGMVFDLDKGSTLHIDLAKSNSRSKRSRADDGRTDTDKKARGSFSSGANDSGYGSIHLPGMANSAHNMIAYPSTQSHGNFEARAGNERSAGKSKNSSTSSHPPKTGTPCPTLFVANLGASCTEQELIEVFSRFAGFLKLKIQSTYGPPVAFVDFQDTASSTAAINSLQGTILYSSPDGMRLEYPSIFLSLFSPFNFLPMFSPFNFLPMFSLNEFFRFAKSRMGKPRKAK